MPVPEALKFDPIAEAGRQWRARWGASAAAPMEAVTSIMRAHQVLLSRLNDVLMPYDLSFARYEALMLLFLSRKGSLPLGKMGVRLQVHPTSVTNLVDGLEKRGYANRISHPSDRRTTLAEITSAGRDVASRATDDLNAASFGTAPLKTSELRSITSVVERLRRDAGDFDELG